MPARWLWRTQVALVAALAIVLLTVSLWLGVMHFALHQRPN
jgi:hypothetical protein